MRRVRVCGGKVFKRYASRGTAEVALARADWLGQSGILTPCGSLALHGRLIAFAAISGQSGRTAVNNEVRRIEPSLLRPIVRLHALTPALALPRFDPLAKVLPRLDAWAAAQLQAEVARALEVIDSIELSSSVIHGDLHDGQFVFDETGEPWLLDLDDLSEGDPAADLGNFAAHLATRDDFGRSRPNDSLSLWLEAALAAYSEAGGRAKPPLVAAYGRLALIRRALKFRERGNPDLLAALCRAA
jgi:hypothetical protein